MMNQEVWKAVPGFDGYEISNCGRVKSSQRVVLRKNNTECSVSEKYRIVHMGNAGYKMVTLYKNGARHCNTIAYWMCLSFHGAKPTPDHQVNHIDGIKTNDSPHNLEWKVPTGNLIHAYDNGLAKKKHSMTESVLSEIIEVRSNGFSYKDIAEKFRLNWHYVQKIFNGKRHRVMLNKMGYKSVKNIDGDFQLIQHG